MVEQRFSSLEAAAPKQLRGRIVVLTNRAETDAFVRVVSEMKDGPPDPQAESILASLQRKFAGSMMKRLQAYQATKRAARRAKFKATALQRRVEAMRMMQRAQERVAKLLARHQEELRTVKQAEEEAYKASRAADEEAASAVAAADAEESAEKEHGEEEAKKAAARKLKAAQALTRSHRRRFDHLAAAIAAANTAATCQPALELDGSAQVLMPPSAGTGSSGEFHR